MKGNPHDKIITNYTKCDSILMSFSAYFHVTFTLADRCTCSSQERWTKVHELQNQSFPGRTVAENLSRKSKNNSNKIQDLSSREVYLKARELHVHTGFLNGYCKPLILAYGQCHRHGILWQNCVVKHSHFSKLPSVSS